MKKVYLKSQFIKEVEKEARALRKNATKKEIANLNLVNFDPDSQRQCIYGQMTNDCQSKRAAELINKCCIRYFERPQTGVGFNIKEKGLAAIKQTVNGKKVKDFINERMGSLKHLSSIEAYILLPNAKNAHLISFLRGETDTLTL